MSRIASVLLALLGLLSLLSVECNDKKSTTPNGQFNDRLTVGSGSSGLDLIGETTVFSQSPVSVYFRLESQEDLAGSPVLIELRKEGDSGFESYREFIVPNPQSTSHILVSSFLITESGRYEATGVIANSAHAVATAGFTVL